MKQELFGQLDDLQLQLNAMDLDGSLDSDSTESTDSTDSTDNQSIRSLTTAATSVQLSPIRNHNLRPNLKSEVKQNLCVFAARPQSIAKSSATMRNGTYNLGMILECLDDMAVQENEQIEKCLAEVTAALSQSVGMNSYSVGKGGLFPVKGRGKVRGT